METNCDIDGPLNTASFDEFVCDIGKQVYWHNDDMLLAQKTI